MKNRIHLNRKLLTTAAILLITILSAHAWYYSETCVANRLNSVGAKISYKRIGRLPISRGRQWLNYFGFKRQKAGRYPIAVQFESPQCALVRLKDASSLAAVHFVRINDLPFVEDDVRHLQSLRNLGSLEFRQTDLTDEGLRLACQVPSVHTLEVSGSKVTDNGTAYLGQLPNLQMVRLNQTNVTDACIENLLRCPKLHQVWLHDTKVSPEAIERLKQHCEVWH